MTDPQIMHQQVQYSNVKRSARARAWAQLITVLQEDVWFYLDDSFKQIPLLKDDIFKYLRGGFDNIFKLLVKNTIFGIHIIRIIRV